MNIKRLGNNIKKYRLLNNLTQMQLANKLNVSRQMISMWEKGMYAPNIEMISLLVKTLNISIDKLFNNKRINQKRKIEISIKPLININFSLININMNKRRIK